MSIAECYVINVQCDGQAHGPAFIPRDQFTGNSKRAAMANLRDCGWKLGPNHTAYCRECKVPAHGVGAVQPWEVKVHCSKGERTLRAGMRWTDSLHGGTWEVVEPSGTRSYSPSGFGGTPSFWCRFVGEPAQHKYRDYARDDGCVEFCGDSIAAGLTRAAGVALPLKGQPE